MAKRTKKPAERADKKAHAATIRGAFLQLIKRNKRKPTNIELAAETGLHVNTISTHMQELEFKTEGNPFKILTDDVILGIYRAAMSGTPASQKLWMQIVEGWNEKSETKIEGDLNIKQEPPVILKLGKK